MRNDAIKYQWFNMHFHLEVKYITSQRYLTNIKEKELIHVLKFNTKNGYNIFQGRKKMIFFLGDVTISCYIFYSTNKGIL
jgi:hypothetical protein